MEGATGIGNTESEEYLHPVCHIGTITFQVGLSAQGYPSSVAATHRRKKATVLFSIASHQGVFGWLLTRHEARKYAVSKHYLFTH